MRHPRPPAFSTSQHPLFVTKTAGFAGDWHGDTGWGINAIRAFASRNVKIVYHAGDFGLWGGHDGASYLRKINRTLDKNGMLLVVTPGNHENYDMLEDFPINTYGFACRSHVEPHIWYAPRGHTWEHNGALMASLGGAGSIDREFRTARTFWPQEAITRADVDHFRDHMLTLYNDRVDIFLSHEAPAGIDLGPKSKDADPDTIEYCEKQRTLLREAVDYAAPRAIVHGHWHRWYVSQLDGLWAKTREAYRSEVFGLSHDGTPGNLMKAEIMPEVGLFEVDYLIADETDHVSYL